MFRAEHSAEQTADRCRSVDYGGDSSRADRVLGLVLRWRGRGDAAVFWLREFDRPVGDAGLDLCESRGEAVFSIAGVEEFGVVAEFFVDEGGELLDAFG